MPRLSLGLGVQNIRKVGGRTIFRILISGAGTTTSNGEYVWDGVTFEEGKPVYGFDEFSIRFSIDYWYIYNSTTDIYYYRSIDLITWTIENGDSPAPTSTLYYTP
jgi:hypothetical protein